MKTAIVLGEKTRTGTPFTMVQVDDFAWTDPHVKQDVEERGQDILRTDYGGRPVRLVWIHQDFPEPLGEDVLTALADGALIPWDIVEDRILGDGA